MENENPNLPEHVAALVSAACEEACAYEDKRTVDEKIAFYTDMDAHLTKEVKKAEHELHTALKTQHEVRRKLFNLAYEKRNPGK